MIGPEIQYSHLCLLLRNQPLQYNQTILLLQNPKRKHPTEYVVRPAICCQVKLKCKGVQLILIGQAQIQNIKIYFPESYKPIGCWTSMCSSCIGFISLITLVIISSRSSVEHVASPRFFKMPSTILSDLWWISLVLASLANNLCMEWRKV